jgi:hypothetical protein
MGEGYFENVGVSEGQPSVLKGLVQRIDLKKPDELKAVLSRSVPQVVDMEASKWPDDPIAP